MISVPTRCTEDAGGRTAGAGPPRAEGGVAAGEATEARRHSKRMPWPHALRFMSTPEVRAGAGAAGSSERHARRADETRAGAAATATRETTRRARMTRRAAARRAANGGESGSGHQTRSIRSNGETRRHGHRPAAVRRTYGTADCPSGSVSLRPNDRRRLQWAAQAGGSPPRRRDPSSTPGVTGHR